LYYQNITFCPLFKNNLDNVVYVRVLNSGKLPLGQEIVEQRGLSVSVEYKDLKGNKIDISKLQQGQDFVATVKVSNLKDENVNDVALTQIFPSGWEIVNTRFTDFGDSTTSQARFTDIRDDRVLYANSSLVSYTQNDPIFTKEKELFRIKQEKQRLQKEIEVLKSERKEKSNYLQQTLFSKYSFSFTNPNSSKWSLK